MQNDSVHVDPAQLEAFSNALGQGCGKLSDCMNALSAELATLGRSWQDEQFLQFRRLIAQATRQVEQFSAEAARAQLQLQLDADAARAVQRVAPIGE